jgi:hypothetical protein
MSYFPPYLRVATISLLNLPTLLFSWTRGVESRFLAWSWRWLLGWPLHWSTPVKAHATLSFPLQWCIFFRPTGHYVKDNYSVLSNMAPVYHIVVVRVIWTSWVHIWRLHFCFLGMGYDKMVDERGEKMQMVEEGRKRKYEINTDLFSRWEHHILGLWARPSPFLTMQLENL